MNETSEKRFCVDCKNVVTRPVYCCPCRHVETGKEYFCSNVKDYVLWRDSVTGDPHYRTCSDAREDIHLRCGPDGRWFKRKEEPAKPDPDKLLCEIIHSQRTLNLLEHFADIHTVGELCQKTRLDMLKIGGIGRVTVAGIESALKRHGLELKPDPKSDHWTGKNLSERENK